MTAAAGSFLAALAAAAEQAKAAEARFRHEAAQRIAALERERAVAYRRLNLMRAIADAVAEMENEEVAGARACLELRGRLGWSQDSEARAEVLARFAAVGRAVFRSFAPSEDAAAAPGVSVEDALAGFEAWYARERRTPFWLLFDQYVVETPLVDF
jgi:C4-dicarboxylate-specific signal transduction histidine kinase